LADGRVRDEVDQRQDYKFSVTIHTDDLAIVNC
jgi:hypothetical protein